MCNYIHMCFYVYIYISYIYIHVCVYTHIYNMYTYGFKNTKRSHIDTWSFISTATWPNLKMSSNHGRGCSEGYLRKFQFILSAIVQILSVFRQFRLGRDKLLVPVVWPALNSYPGANFFNYPWDRWRSSAAGKALSMSLCMHVCVMVSVFSWSLMFERWFVEEPKPWLECMYCEKI